MDPGKASNLQGLKEQPILHVPELGLLIAQKYRPLNEQGPEILADPVAKEQSETLFQGVLTHNVDRAFRLGGHLTNSTANDVPVRQEAIVLVDFNNPVVAAPALAGEAGVGHDEGKRKKNEEN